MLMIKLLLLAMVYVALETVERESKKEDSQNLA